MRGEQKGATMYTKEEITRLNQIGYEQGTAFSEIRHYVELTVRDYITYKELAEKLLPLVEQILRLESQAEVIEFLRQMREKEKEN